MPDQGVKPPERSGYTGAFSLVMDFKTGARIVVGIIPFFAFAWATPVEFYALGPREEVNLAGKDWQEAVANSLDMGKVPAGLSWKPADILKDSIVIDPGKVASAISAVHFTCGFASAKCRSTRWCEIKFNACDGDRPTPGR